jgi:hypothetical protein
VRCAAAASTISGSARIENARLKWSSPSHAVSKPELIAELDLRQDVPVTLALRKSARTGKLIEKAEAHLSSVYRGSPLTLKPSG